MEDSFGMKAAKVATYFLVSVLKFTAMVLYAKFLWEL